ncbi:MAG: DUF2703 domain-containing protein [Chloroflexi bacterium]|nr:DUF2703 domain-containing protein [Chloroflexota bacterium]
MHIDFLYFEDCPSHDVALARLREVLAEEQVTAAITVIKVETEQEAVANRFVGSPTIRIEGEDIDPPPADMPYVLACRAYRRPDDGRITPLPTASVIRKAVRAHKKETSP